MLSENSINRYAQAYLSDCALVRQQVTLHRVFAEHGGVGLLLLAERIGEPLDVLIKRADLDERFARWARRMGTPSHRRRSRRNGAHVPGHHEAVREVARQATQGWRFARPIGRGGSHLSPADRRAWTAARTHQ